MDNAGVALRIIEALQPAHCAATIDPFPISENDILEGMRRVKWPGRLQMIQTDPMILLDGAHNQAGAHALANYLQGVDPSRLGKHFVMIGILREKNIRQMLSLIAPWADEIVLTRPDIERAADPSELYALLEEPIPTTVQKTVADAISYVEARLKPNDTLVITGSLYTVGEALAYFQGVTLSPIRG
jgi:dihydrofolate synthase/folylpolyglutamate synthase